MILSAGVIPVRRSSGEYRFLLLRVFSYWDFPKGEIDPGEHPLEAAKRETAEETGIRDLQFPWGDGFHETPAYGRGKIARYYLALTDNENVKFGINPELGGPEHHEYRWVSAEEAAGLLNDRVRRALNWALARIEERAP